MYSLAAPDDRSQISPDLHPRFSSPSCGRVFHEHVGTFAWVPSYIIISQQTLTHGNVTVLCQGYPREPTRSTNSYKDFNNEIWVLESTELAHPPSSPFTHLPSSISSGIPTVVRFVLEIRCPQTSMHVKAHVKHFNLFDDFSGLPESETRCFGNITSK